jgi:hypothetical protein
MTRSAWRSALLVLSASLLPATAVAQSAPPEWMKSLASNPADPKTKAQRDLRKKQIEVRQKMRKVNATHFRVSHRPTREKGIEALKQFNEPWMFEPMLEVFQEDTNADVRNAVVALMRDSKSDLGDRGLAWLVVSHTNTDWQDAAVAALRERLADEKQVPSPGMLAVLQAAVATHDQRIADNASIASDVLNLYEMIPFLIQAQAGAAPATNALGRPRNGPLAWVAIARQQAYIADLEPIVNEGGVAFDPIPGVVNSGVVLVINDAAATFSPVMIGNSLRRLGSRVTGEETRGLARDTAKWKEWYFAKGEPAIAKASEKRLEDEKARLAAADPAKAATTPTTPAEPLPTPGPASTSPK